MTGVYISGKYINTKVPGVSTDDSQGTEQVFVTGIPKYVIVFLK
jgi:hypothetical protein